MSGEFDNTSENNAVEHTKIVTNDKNLYQNEDAAAAAPNMNSPQRKGDNFNDMLINQNILNTQMGGLGDVQIDEILECGDDLMDIE